MGLGFKGQLGRNEECNQKLVGMSDARFIKEGGWSFLGNTFDDKDEENISDDKDSAFEVSDIYEELSPDSGLESYNEDALNDSGSGSDSFGGDGSSFSDALDWPTIRRRSRRFALMSAKIVFSVCVYI
ncbi:hypothetical protein PPACK8108_LOCUS18604 [Phakopsora pachyrhizi]|uniref:Uncharacterized protein n=1 Tax=Phakopsora pachyrhizi TaxID=170000 RepID=A0AAV0BDM4_PHAPC|nr:hypothetical protein PPACK8108_LOCUS18604 [Phakopsora pachyrhizi]